MNWQELIVLADFDRTLTKAFDDQGRHCSLMSALRDEKILDEDYVREAQEAYSYYRPIEIDESLSLEYREAKMKEWEDTSFARLIKYGLRREQVRLTAEKSRVQLRAEVDRFLAKLAEKQTPLLIMTANGLGTEAVNFFLEREGLLFENIKVIGNEFIWDGEGRMIGVEKPIVRIFNKNFQLAREHRFWDDDWDQRKQALALGDNIADVKMLQGCQAKEVVKIGFLNERVEELREDFRRSYDYVIEDDGDFSVPNRILEEMG